MMERINLNPGQLFFSSEPIEVCGKVSSGDGFCVALCIHSAAGAYGGTCSLSLANVSVTLMQFLKRFKEHGATPSELSAKILGVAHHEASVLVASVQTELHRFGIKVNAVVAEGTGSRHFVFDTSSGDVKHRLIIESPTLTKTKIGVMIVDDSQTMRQVIKKLFKDVENISVVAEADSAESARELLKASRPDVVTLDIKMPGMDGVTFLKEIKHDYPDLPVIMLSSLDLEESGPVFDALHIGAFDYLKKPSLDQLSEAQELLSSLVLEAHRGRQKKLVSEPKSRSVRHVILNENILNSKLIVIGSSTGGVEALSEILPSLPAAMPPILITQHIPASFSNSLAKRLDAMCAFPVREAKDSEEIVHSTALIAPGGRHLGVTEIGSKLFVKLSDEPPINKFRPSVDYLFDSVAKVKRRKLVAVILTGMGKDGAAGMKNLFTGGATTIAQDERSCVVFGMPKSAIELGAAKLISSLGDIPEKIVQQLL